MSTLPPTPRRIIATVTEHREVAPQHFKLRLAIGELAGTIHAGQFVHVLSRSATVSDPLLRRAFSIMSVGADSIEVLFRIVGQGTAWLSQLTVGAQVDLLLPLGKPFAPLAADSILVGGGVGVPPLVMLASTRNEEQVRAIVGARTANDLIGLPEFETFGVSVEVSTDDGSAGHHGRVTDLLEPHLQTAGTKPTVYTCGPFAMLKAVATMCQKYEARCQVSLEENMPCGVGICNGCVVPVNGAGDDYGRYRRICVDGPVVWADEIDWNHLSLGGSCH